LLDFLVGIGELGNQDVQQDHNTSNKVEKHEKLAYTSENKSIDCSTSTIIGNLMQ
jgi:hypothetical protein